MLFLATPHRGSAHATVLNGILRTTPAKNYVAELMLASASSHDINEQFCEMCDDMELVSLYETQRTHLGLGVKKMVGPQV